MTLKTNLMAGAAMTPVERAMGRLMRAPDGHDAASSTPAPAPAPAPASTDTSPDTSNAADFGMEDDFSVFEKRAKGDNASAADKDSGDVDPAPSEQNNADEGAPDPKEDQPGSSVQERIDELTAARREAERREAEERRQREARDAELAEIKAKLEALEGKKPEGEEGKKTRDPGEEPNPDDYEYGKADADYIIDMAEYRQEAKLREREQQLELKREFDTMEAGWSEQISAEDIKTQYPDFEEKVVKGADNAAWKLSLEGAILVKTSPVGAHVAYHLASNPAEAERISGLDTFEQAREIGRIEGRFLGARQEQPNQGAKQPVASKAPPPPKHTARGAGGRFSTDPATDDFTAFEQMSVNILSEAR